MNPIEIAFVVGKMKGGGVEATTLSYLKNLDASKIHITFIIDEDSTLIPKDTILQYGGDIEIIPPYQHQIRYQRALSDLFRRRHFDIVHAHISTMSVFPLFAAVRAGIPVRIVHAHSTAGKGEWKKNILKYLLRPFSKVFATQLCACSEFAGIWMYGKKTKFFVMPNAIDFCAEEYRFNAKVRNEIRKELNLEGSVVFGHVGRFIPQKNHQFLIDIFAQIKERMPNARLLLVGSGELMEQIRQKVSDAGLRDAVIFAGQRNDVAALYQAMDALLLPSCYEGKPLVAIEAQYAGLPVIVSDCITKEIVVAEGLVQFLPLSTKPSAWADLAVKTHQIAPQREKLILREEKTLKNGISVTQLGSWYYEQTDCYS